MLFAIDWNAVEPAVWSVIGQLLVITVVAFVANIVYRRFRDLATAREDLLEEIDQFSIQLYRPRKLYQVMLDCGDQFLAGVSTPEQRDCERLKVAHESLNDLVAAIGRFRTLQVEIIRLYGYDLDLLGRYLAIWRFLKETRRRMERCEPLYLPGEGPGSDDSFYQLFDSFRYRVSETKFVFSRPPAARPPADVLAQIRQRGTAIFAEYFSAGVVAEKADRDGG